MSNTYYCHGCEARRPVIWTPIVTCARCGCNIVDQVNYLKKKKKQRRDKQAYLISLLRYLSWIVIVTMI